jgi:hypothetical protein
MPEVTHILDDIGQSNHRATALLLPLVSDELWELAGQCLIQKKPSPPLQATILHSTRGE